MGSRPLSAAIHPATKQPASQNKAMSIGNGLVSLAQRPAGAGGVAKPTCHELRSAIRKVPPPLPTELIPLLQPYTEAAARKHF
jgi:hypothetical protein